MAGINWTYGQVRNHVQGSGCTKGDDRLQIMIVACLQELWTKVWDDPFYEESVSVALAEGVSTVDISAYSKVSSIKVRYLDDDDEERCRTLTSSAELPPIKNCGCTVEEDELCEHSVTGIPGDFSISGDTITFSPVPDRDLTIDLVAYREVDCTLYVETDDVRVWSPVDLPDRYQPQLANLVLSKFYAEEGDFAAATYWEQKVSTGLDSLITVRESRYKEDAGVDTSTRGISHKIIRRGSEKASGCSCGTCVYCLPMEQTIYEEVLVDCEGTRIT